MANHHLALSRLDRRWIFLGVAVAVTLPMFLGISLPTPAGKPVLDVYRFLDRLPRGSRVWFGYDAYASTTAEVGPAATALSRHLFSRGCRLVCTSTIPDGAMLARKYVGRVAQEMGQVYGRDYCILGYKSGDKIAVNQMSMDLRAAFPTDLAGTPVAQLEVMQGVRNARDFACVVTCSDNRTFDYYAIIVHSQHGTPIVGAATAVMVAELYPYYNSGQIKGMLGGLRGAAEYEGLVNHPGNATAGMLAQSVVHFLICGMILVSNAFYLLRRRR
ncbi:MAG: hypothetical protein AB1758_04320 [Candidatus Eremiobacterota bacterium]